MPEGDITDRDKIFENLIDLENEIDHVKPKVSHVCWKLFYLPPTFTTYFGHLLIWFFLFLG